MIRYVYKNEGGDFKMGEKLESPEERMAALQVEVNGMVDRYLEENNRGGLTTSQINEINGKVRESLFEPSLSRGDINVNDEFVLDVGEVVPETGGRRGVKFASVGRDGKPKSGEGYGGLPASLVNVKEGDRVIIVGLSTWVDAADYGVKFGEPTWILAKKVETKD